MELDEIKNKEEEKKSAVTKNVISTSTKCTEQLGFCDFRVGPIVKVVDNDKFDDSFSALHTLSI